MLPDFPTPKAKLSKWLEDYLRHKQKEYLGIWSQLPVHNKYEGDTWSLSNFGEVPNQQEYQHIRAGLAISKEEVPNLPLNKLIEKLDKVAEDLASQLSDGIFKTLTDDLEDSGQTVDGTGRPFSEVLLTLYEKLSFDFDQYGKPLLPKLVVNPNDKDRIHQQIIQLQNDPNYRARYKQLIDRKKAAWRDRENSRKLVD